MNFRLDSPKVWEMRLEMHHLVIQCLTKLNLIESYSNHLCWLYKFYAIFIFHLFVVASLIDNWVFFHCFHFICSFPFGNPFVPVVPLACVDVTCVLNLVRVNHDINQIKL